MSAEARIKRQQEFVAWLKLQKMYDPMASYVIMQSMQKLFDKLSPALDMLEETVSMLEPLSDIMANDKIRRFKEICAQTADLRDGTHT